MSYSNSYVSYKTALLLFLVVLNGFRLTAQLDAYFSTGKFNTPKNEPFIETYLTLVGKSLASKTVDTKLQNSVTIDLKIYKDSVLVKANKYNLLGPLFLSPENSPS